MYRFFPQINVVFQSAWSSDPWEHTCIQNAASDTIFFFFQRFWVPGLGFLRFSTIFRDYFFMTTISRVFGQFSGTIFLWLLFPGFSFGFRTIFWDYFLWLLFPGLVFVFGQFSRTIFYDYYFPGLVLVFGQFSGLFLYDYISGLVSVFGQFSGTIFSISRVWFWFLDNFPGLFLYTTISRV